MWMNSYSAGEMAEVLHGVLKGGHESSVQN